MAQTPPTCQDAAVSVGINPLPAGPVNHGTEICYTVCYGAQGAPLACNIVDFSARLFFPDGTMIQVVSDVSINADESFCCPSADPRCNPALDATDYCYVVDHADEVTSFAGCPPMESGTSGRVVAYTQGLGTSLTEQVDVVAPCATANNPVAHGACCTPGCTGTDTCVDEVTANECLTPNIFTLGATCDTAPSCDFACCGDAIVNQACETCDGLARASGVVCNQACREAGEPGAECEGESCTCCGDGIEQPSEECDDGNAIDTDGCRNDCTLPECGDDIVNQACETCDGDARASGVVCLQPCREPAAPGAGCVGDSCTCCGDSLLNGDETCDRTVFEPGAPAGRTCRTDCTFCGDGVVQTGEECDDGDAVDTDECRNDCTLPECGDDIVNQACETCDGAARASGVVCLQACREPAVPGAGCVGDSCTCCGDNLLNGDETCDRTVFEPGAPAGRTCRDDCTFCGDGVIQTGEECDDGNAVDTDACRNNCLLPLCGDDIVNQACETCDGAARASGVVCLQACREPAVPGAGCVGDSCTCCGDSLLNGDETCDRTVFEAGAPAGRTCRTDCTFCGDGVVQTGEDCDDGNAVDTDDCRNDCTIPECGDGIINQACETCDGAARRTGVTCNQACRPGSGEGCVGESCTCCGDGIVQPSEECDDGNAVNTDQCKNDCTLPDCGDGIINQACENCDGAARAPGIVCNQACRPGTGGECVGESCTCCGDGELQPSEECDDGNAVNGDGCNSSCELEECEVLVDKQVSCDGMTWLDATLVLNNEDGTNGPGTGAASPCTAGDPVFVRYVARNTGDLAAVCTLDESSSVIEPAVDGIVLADFEIAIGDTTDPITPSGAPICDASLTAQEPDTITLSCECERLNGAPLEASATDTATIACEGNFAGCTPGFWKQPHHLQYWCDAFAPSDLVYVVFTVPQTTNNNKSLLKALQTGGGGEIAMLRHAVAALLNSCNEEVEYFYSTAEVIELVQEAYDTGDFSLAHGLLAEQNELGCTVDKSNSAREESSRGRSQLNKGDR